MAAFPDMLRRDRERRGLRECQAAWRFGVSVREYRELEAGKRSPRFEPWEPDL
jgi:transcriptional regulator with XRE-family HTH domain